MMPNPATDRAERIFRVANLVSWIWLGLVLAYAAGYIGTLAPAGGRLWLAVLGFAAAIALPVALIRALAWQAAELISRQTTAETLATRLAKMERTTEMMERRLATAEASLRTQSATVPPVAPRTAPDPGPVSAPTDMPRQQAEDLQPGLPLEGGSDSREGLSLDDAIRALNFPQDAQDRAGFAVLRRALADQDLARLLQASEDCLNMLALQGLYMDDLMPAGASPQDWRAFAKGGATRAALMPMNGITDTAALETVRGQMRGDPIFRDSALYFQRRFDQMLQQVAPEADDTSLLQLVDTRSGRAFVLLAQVASMRDNAGDKEN